MCLKKGWKGIRPSKHPEQREIEFTYEMSVGVEERKDKLFVGGVLIGLIEKVFGATQLTGVVVDVTMSDDV